MRVVLRCKGRRPHLGCHVCVTSAHLAETKEKDKVSLCCACCGTYMWTVRDAKEEPAAAREPSASWGVTMAGRMGCTWVCVNGLCVAQAAPHIEAGVGWCKRWRSRQSEHAVASQAGAEHGRAFGVRVRWRTRTWRS